MAFRGTLTGNLGQDPALRFTQSGKAVLDLSIAATPNQMNKQTQQWERVGTDIWIRTNIWGAEAEKLAEILHKGDKVSVEGTLVHRTYDRRDGSGQGISYELAGARFLGVVPRSGQINPGINPGTPNGYPADNYTGSSVQGAQNGSWNEGGNNVAPF